MTARTLLPLVMVGLLAGAAPAAADPADYQQVPAAFAEHVARYADIHQAVVQLVGLDAVHLDPAALQKREQEFAIALRQVRQFARAGDIFTPEIATFFRAHIAKVVRATGYDTAKDVEAAYGEGEGLEDAAALEVNGMFPRGAGRATPEWLLWRLPPLPMELEYRFFGTTLVLVDTRAGLVVDLLEAALPADPGHPPAPPKPRPCDVHPDLPACWT